MKNEQALEEFGIADKETGELIVDRLALKRHFVNKGVYLLREIEMLKADIKSIVEEAKEDHNFNKASLNKLIKYVYDNTIDEDIEELEQVKVEIANLFPEDYEESGDE